MPCFDERDAPRLWAMGSTYERGIDNSAVSDAAHDRNLASLDQETTEIKARKTSSVLAPQAGQVSMVHLSLGAMAQAGQTIASLVPQVKAHATDHSAHTLLAALFAPTRTTGFIQPGQEVWLRLAAYPYQKFGHAKAPRQKKYNQI